jgi:hypothetical protein
MKIKWRSPCFILAALVLLVLPSAVLAAEDVVVYAEGAYNSQYLDVYVYADINNGVTLCSYGVKLKYTTVTGILTTPVAANVSKNETVWYFGTSGDKKPYMAPDISTAGAIIFIGGKLDTGTPTVGVSGTRVLLGSARFTREESSLNLGTGAETHFGISVERGKLAPYDNFVTPTGTVKDSGVVYSATVRQRGDANADGSVNVQDMSAVRNYIVSGGIPYAWMDCSADSAVNVQDMSCIRNLIVTGHY